MTLIFKYQEAVDAGEIQEDRQQRQALVTLEALAKELNSAKSSWFSFKKKLIGGAYLYGSVGVGKTYVMDLFYENIPCKLKKRFHFHHFMQQIDMQLRQKQGQKNPLKLIIKNLAATTELLCLDEFMVSDVAHAMILAELLQTLFLEGITLVITSNLRPDDLYAQGLHRERFLPAIAAIKANCKILHFTAEHDYRLDTEAKANMYLYPLGEMSMQILQKCFADLIKGQVLVEAGKLRVQNREIVTLCYSSKTVWFDFKALCNLPRSQLDYLELANRFDTIFISNIPVLTEADTVYALLFVLFIDVMYDQGVRLIMQAACPIEKLYLKGELIEEFKRTRSRLQEMQSSTYLARHPRRLRQTLS